jgi:hypothetical protein
MNHSTSYSMSFRDTAIAIIVFVLGLGFDTTDSSSQFRTRKSRVGCLIRQTSYGGESDVDSSWG